MSIKSERERQRRQARRAAGCCRTCGKPDSSGYANCESCNGKPHKWPTKAGPWQDVNWSLNNYEIARQIGCTPQCVLRARRKLGIPSLARGRHYPTKTNNA